MNKMVESLLNGEIKQHNEPVYFDRWVLLHEQLLGFERLVHSRNFRYILECEGVENDR